MKVPVRPPRADTEKTMKERSGSQTEPEMEAASLLQESQITRAPQARGVGGVSDGWGVSPQTPQKSNRVVSLESEQPVQNAVHSRPAGACTVTEYSSWHKHNARTDIFSVTRLGFAPRLGYGWTCVLDSWTRWTARIREAGT